MRTVQRRLGRARGARLTALLAVAVAAVSLPAVQPEEARATPVASDPSAYRTCARVFPDPHAYWPSPRPAPGESPFANGNGVCRSQDFIQFGEFTAGMEFLQSIDPADYPTLHPEGGRPFGDFVELQRLDEDHAASLDLEGGIEGLSAGLPRTDGTRQRFPLYMVKVTDKKSDIPEPERAHFVFALSIHGIERAGAEGGIRAIEDLVTWAATDPDRPLQELDPTRSVSVGEALRSSVVYFLLANPDGWARGDTSQQNFFYQRYNGNGIDLNRDWPSQGFTFRPYTPLSEPESRSFAKVLLDIKNRTKAKRFTGGNDLHGQLIDRAFSFTLIGGAKRPFDKNDEALDAMVRIWADQESRLSWSPLIKPNSAPEDDPRVYGDQYGTIWDTIAYTVTGALGDWIDQPIGLDGLGLDNEMSLSHLINCGTGKCYDKDAEQLHIDGNKGLIYAQMNVQLLGNEAVFRQPGKTAYVTNPYRVKEASSSDPRDERFANLPPQEDLQGSIAVPPATPFEFDVLGPSDGVYNGGLTVTVTYTNVQGVQTGLTGVLVEKQTDDEHEDPDGDGWETVNADYNQSFVYAQAGMTVNVNAPTPGRYRVRFENPTPGLHDVQIRFTSELSWPDPGQVGYDVSNIDFLRELDEHTLAGYGFTEVTVDEILAGRADLSAFDNLVLVDRFMPGWQPSKHRPEERAVYSDAQRDTYLDRLAAFAEGGGNLVLTDGALEALRYLDAPDGSASPFAEAVREVFVYAGHTAFNDGSGETYEKHPIAKEIDLPGAAEGPGNRKQTAEPVPTGYAIQDPDDNDFNSHPQWIVDQAAWEGAGGITVGTTTGDSYGPGERPTFDAETEPEQASGVSLGELPYGDGVVRVIGSLLPMPTEQFDHPFGLAAYGVTFSGYQIFDNLLQYVRPGAPWRLAGADRYETSAEVALQHWYSPENVVIANGETFADALAAVPLAKAVDAPILLTKKGGLPKSVFDYLLRRNPAVAKAYVVGGDAVIGEQVLDDLSRVYVGEVERLAGADRFETAVAVARELEEVTGEAPSQAVVATGRKPKGLDAWPDALAAGPVAANLGPDRAPVPLLLTDVAFLPQVVRDYLEEKGIESTLVAGGPAAVSDRVVQALPSPRRVAGQDRTQTAARLADELGKLLDDPITAATVATMRNFPDALVVGSAGGRDGIPTLLTDPAGLSAATRDWLKAHAGELDRVYIAGGPAVVAEDVLTRVAGITER